MKRRQKMNRAVPIESVVERAARPRHSGAQTETHTKDSVKRKPSKGRIRSETFRERTKRQYVSPGKQRTERQ